METKSLIALLFSALALSALLTGASPERPLVTAGLPLAAGTEGTFIFLQSEDPGPPAVYQVFRKAGGEYSTDTYQLVGQIRPQTDPRTINALLLRGEALFGDDLSALESTLDGFLQAMVDDPAVAEITNAEKLATLIDVANTDAEIRDNLRMLAKRFKGVGLATGIAFAESISGEYTYELRQADFPDQDPADANLVISRLTIDTTTAAPLLPAPTKLVAIPMSDARGNRVVRLRWASPDTLRQRGPIHYGYQLYRDGVPVNDQPILPREELSESEAEVTAIDDAIEARFSYPTDWQWLNISMLENDPSYSTYAFPATEAERNAARQIRIAQQQTLEDLQGDFHFIDDGGLASGTGSGLMAGASHDYTVAALDVLGRPGTESDSITVVVAGLEPPNAPKGVQVTNDYYYDSFNDSSTQQLKVRWPALLDDAGNVRYDVSYIVYRWNTPTEYLRYAEYPWGHGSTEMDPAYAGRPLPPIGMVAAPGDITTPMDGYLEWIDPTVDINYQSLQIHYTVRAVVDSGSGFPVMSGHSAPAMGILRDREGPGSATNIGVRLPCPDIQITCGDASNFGSQKGPGNTAFLKLRARITNSAQFKFFKAAAFAYRTSSEDPWQTLPTASFASDGTVFTRISMTNGDFPPGIYISCRVQLENGYWSEATECAFQLPKGLSSGTLNFNVLFNGYSYDGSQDCGSVFYPYEVDGTEIDPAFTVTPAADTYAYSFYRRVDGSRLELMRNEEFEEELSTADALTLIDETPPNFFKRLCYYYQGRDQHGNPGPLQRLDCLDFGGAQSAMPTAQITRVYRTNTSTDANPGLTLEFFCPPEGVESFLIEVRNPNADVPMSLTAFDPDNRALNGTVVEKAYPENHRYAAYSTIATSLLREEAGVFSVDFGGIQPDVDYVFRVIARGPYYGDSNAPETGPVIQAIEGTPSPEVTGNWRALAPREDTAVPQVRWPARGNIVPVSISNTALNPTGPIGAAYVNAEYSTTPIWQGIGIEVASFFVPNEADFVTYITYPDQIDGKPQTSPQIPQVTTYLNMDQPENWSQQIYEITIAGPLEDSPPVTRPLFPCVLYRMMVDGNGDPISGDLVQCSPLIANDNTLAAIVNPTGSPAGFYFFDPFLVFGNPYTEGTGIRVPLYIKDNQPVIRKESYTYYLALLDERGEVQTILDLGITTIP
jgi:hypothetical protein